jgi:polyhydroxyalkanoate synthase
VERWSLDELPLARQLVVDSEEQLYREDAFLRGKLALGSQTASAREVVMPLLVVADPRCLIIPPQAVLPFVEAAGATDKRLLWYEGDVGVAIQHLGMLIGRNAHRQLWPEILHWVHAHRRPSSF